MFYIIWIKLTIYLGRRAGLINSERGSISIRFFFSMKAFVGTLHHTDWEKRVGSWVVPRGQPGANRNPQLPTPASPLPPPPPPACATGRSPCGASGGGTLVRRAAWGGDGPTTPRAVGRGRGGSSWWMRWSSSTQASAAAVGDPVRLGSVAGDGHGGGGARRQCTAVGCCWLGAAARCLHCCGLHGPDLGQFGP
jgi:hypothetical protein